MQINKTNALAVLAVDGPGDGDEVADADAAEVLRAEVFAAGGMDPRLVFPAYVVRAAKFTPLGSKATP